MTLKEIIHSIQKDKHDGLVHLDDWRFPDLDHLVTMGFQFEGDYRMATDKEPEITVYKKSEQKDGKNALFYVEEKGKATRRFKEFNEVIDYFDHYSQPEIDNLK